LKRTAAAYKIDQNNVVAEYTRPEVAFDQIFGHRVTKPLPIEIVDDERSKWTLSPDRHFLGTNVLVQIDGVYHRTRRQEQKSKWEDEALNERGFRVLHIDSGLLMVKKYEAHIRQGVEAFLQSKEPSKRLPL
jgi:hypothetical protein